jgi:hypothetical protein
MPSGRSADIDGKMKHTLFPPFVHPNYTVSGGGRKGRFENILTNDQRKGNINAEIGSAKQEEKDAESGICAIHHQRRCVSDAKDHPRF